MSNRRRCRYSFVTGFNHRPPRRRHQPSFYYLLFCGGNVFLLHLLFLPYSHSCSVPDEPPFKFVANCAIQWRFVRSYIEVWCSRIDVIAVLLFCFFLRLASALVGLDHALSA